MIFTLMWWGGVSNEEVLANALTRTACWNNATTFEQNKQIFFMLRPDSSWKKIDQSSLLIFSIFVCCMPLVARTNFYSKSNIYPFIDICTAPYHISYHIYTYTYIYIHIHTTFHFLSGFWCARSLSFKVKWFKNWDERTWQNYLA